MIHQPNFQIDSERMPHLYSKELTDSLEDLGVDGIHDERFHGDLQVVHVGGILLHGALWGRSIYEI